MTSLFVPSRFDERRRCDARCPQDADPHRQAPTLHFFGWANAVGLDQDHPLSQEDAPRIEALSHTCLTGWYVLYSGASGSWLVKLLTEGRLKVVLFVAGTAHRLMTSPSRVVMVSNYGSLGGGAAAVFRDIGLALREKQPDLDLVAVCPWKGSLAKECARHGMRTKIAFTPWWGFAERSRTPRIEALIGALPRGALILPGILQALLLLARLRPTMVLSNTMLIPSHAIAAKLLGIPHYWLVHEFGRDDHQLGSCWAIAGPSA